MAASVIGNGVKFKNIKRHKKGGLETSFSKIENDCVGDWKWCQIQKQKMTQKRWIVNGLIFKIRK
jgi:hypothetical protein